MCSGFQRVFYTLKFLLGIKQKIPCPLGTYILLEGSGRDNKKPKQRHYTITLRATNAMEKMNAGKLDKVR